MPNFPASGLGENLLTLPYSGFVRKWGTPQNGGVLYGQIHILYIYIYICYILYIIYTIYNIDNINIYTYIYVCLPKSCPCSRHVLIFKLSQAAAVLDAAYVEEGRVFSPDLHVCT